MCKYLLSALVCIAAMALTSCSKDDHDPAPDPVRVLLVYVGTDNNLSGLEQDKLQGLRDGWTGRTTDRIIVYRDTRSLGARLIEISNLGPGDSPREIANYGTENSADPATLSRVVSDVVGMFPDADSYGLLVFSHASGWLPAGALYNPEGYPARSSRSLIYDNDDEMSLSDFASAIPSGVFDYIAFEACFTAGIEVAYELRDKADYILASSAEIVDPGFGPIYAKATPRLLAGNLRSFGQAAFDHTLAYPQTSPQRSATYSVIKTAGLDALATFVRDNCDLTQQVELADVQHFDRLSGYRLFFDFEDYYARLLNTDAQRQELTRLVGDCVVWRRATDVFMTQLSSLNGFVVSNHSGLTTYIPQSRFSRLNTAYNNLSWAQAIGQD